MNSILISIVEKKYIFFLFVIPLIILCLLIIYPPINLYLNLALYSILSLIFLGIIYFKERGYNKIILYYKQSSPDIINRYFENSIDLLCIAGIDGRFQKLNPEWEIALGYKHSKLEEKPFLEFVHPDDVEDTLKATSSLAENKRFLILLTGINIKMALIYGLNGNLILLMNLYLQLHEYYP
jgi:hypothetical protein